MSGQKKSGHLSKIQKRRLIELLSSNNRLRSGKFSSDFTCRTAQEEWEKIAYELNSLPGINKTWKMWRKGWQDLFNRAKGKKAAFARASKGTGGGPPPEPLDEFDESISSLINNNSIVGHEDVFESAVVFDYQTDHDYTPVDFVTQDITGPVTTTDSMIDSTPGTMIDNSSGTMIDSTPGTMIDRTSGTMIDSTPSTMTSTSSTIVNSTSRTTSLITSATSGDTRSAISNITSGATPRIRSNTTSQNPITRRKVNMKSLLKEKVELKTKLVAAQIKFYKDYINIQQERNKILKDLTRSNLNNTIEIFDDSIDSLPPVPPFN